jgi:NitT/TauT family transport system substrate-binding protein
MQRRHIVTALAVSGLSALAKPTQIQAQSPTLEKLRIAGFETDALTPLFYAVRSGMFRRAGLEIEFSSVASGAAATAALLAGTFDLANASLISAMSAYLRDVPIVLVAGQVMYTPQNPYGLLQIAADSPLKTAADLNDKVIGVLALNGFNDLVTRVWVDKNGGDSKTLKFVEIPFSATETALVQHRIDGALMVEPMLSVSLASGKTKTLGDAMGAVANRYMFGAYVADKSWASQHADTVKKFGRVMADSASFTNTHPADTVAMMADLTKTPLAIMQKVKRVVSATSLDAALAQPLIDAAAKYRMIPRAFPAKDFFWSEAGK